MCNKVQSWKCFYLPSYVCYFSVKNARCIVNSWNFFKVEGVPLYTATPNNCRNETIKCSKLISFLTWYT